MNNFDSLQINSIDYSTWIYRKHNSQTQHNKEQNELSDCLSSHRHPRFSSREARCSLPSDHAAPSQQVEEGEEASRGARRMQEHLEGGASQEGEEGEEASRGARRMQEHLEGDTSQEGEEGEEGEEASRGNRWDEMARRQPLRVEGEEGEEAPRGTRRMQEHLEGTTRPCRVGIQPGSMGERKQGWGINGSHKILKQKQKNTKNTQKTHKKQNMVSKWMSWSNNCW